MKTERATSAAGVTQNFHDVCASRTHSILTSDSGSVFSGIYLLAGISKNHL